MEMIATVAVEIFVWLYIGAFAIASVIAIVLLVTAARRLNDEKDHKPDEDPFDHLEP
jgi:membrane protein implicated in regulation of membrane protease activity